MDTIAATKPKALSDCRILIVDDDRMNISILRGILKAEGYQLESAGSGEEALEKYPEYSPDLVLLDVMMPGINGFQVCRQLKEQYGDDCPPIIFITAKNQSNDVVEGFSAGGSDYLPKPFQPGEVVVRIRTHLQSRILAEEQKALVEQLSNANQAKNRFLGMAAHDLRNPLAGIRGLSEFLLDKSFGPLSTDQKDLVNNILTASQSMLQLVNELLDLATIESGELKIDRKETDLIELIRKSIYFAKMNADKKGTTINFAPATETAMLSIDPEKIKQVVDNLLSNAIKYSPPKSVVNVEFIVSASSHSISVKDQGPGIPAGERDKLFKDFGRLSVQPTGGEKSTGLGLAICRKIVEAHGATVTAENLPEKGCEFNVTFPIQS